MESNVDYLLKPPEEFLFPFPPYDIQKDFTKTLYSVLEESKLGIFESPTGTGKSISIICGALKWLKDHDTRNKTVLQEGIILIEKDLEKIDNEASDDWISAHSKQGNITRAKNELLVKLKSIINHDEEINNIKKRIERDSVDTKTVKVYRSNALSVQENNPDEVDEDLLLEDISLEDEDEKELHEEDSEIYECPKIYYCSRTHSQLSQFIGEVQRSTYSNMRVVPLASRQTYCINPSVKKLKNLSLINERCLEMQKSKSGKATKKGTNQETVKKKKCNSSTCPFNNKTAIEKLKDRIVTKIFDVEEIVKEGQKISACPYYATRTATTLSQLVVIPYNTLLHKSTREASKIKLKDNVVIIDEAHNLLDAVGNMYSSHVTGNQLCLCFDQLSNYREKYEKLFSATNLLYLNQLIFVVGQLIVMLGGKGGCNPVESSRKGTDSKVYTLLDFIEVAELDNYNLYTIMNFCQKSKISYKLQNYSQKFPIINNALKGRENGLRSFLKNISDSKNMKMKTQIEPQTLKSPTNDDVSNNPIYSVISFMESLTSPVEDGRIVCTRQTTVGRGSLKFLLLNPAAHFQDIVKEARSVIVAGGTMQPISEFREQLFEKAGAKLDRIITFSCGHVIDHENILPIVLCSGPSGKQLDFSFQMRNTLAVMNELARVLDNICNIVPAGLVCFFPSYEYEQTIYQHLEKSGTLEKLAKKKKIFREPKKTNDVDSVLAEYALYISQSKKNANMKPNGCLLFSVIGGKLSEGLNFSDDLGRCVIVVGLPYPNIKSPELQEKMNYLDKTAGLGSGQEHYENLCMKAVNQSIGRAVRHKNDYATVLLLDHRYSRQNIHTALPQWMNPSLITCDKFSVAFSNLTKFFKSKN